MEPNILTQPAVLMLSGASGFLGKLVLYDHIQSGVYSEVFVLLRPSRTKTVDERWADCCATLCSWGLEDSQMAVVKPVPARLCDKYLGLGADVWEAMTARTTHVVHCAASVSFTSPVKEAATINVRASVNMGEFAAACGHLRHWVHVSTAYVAPPCDGDHPCIEEARLEPTGVSLDPVVLLERIEAGTFDDALFRRAQGHHFNTYTWTKNLTEHIVHNMADKMRLPLTIVRPSIIGPSLSRPRPGWVDSTNAISGLYTLFGLGCIQVHCEPPAASSNVIPVDAVSTVISEVTAGDTCNHTRIVNAAVPHSSELRRIWQTEADIRAAFRLVDTGISPCGLTFYTSRWWVARLHAFFAEDVAWFVYAKCSTRAAKLVAVARSVRENVAHTYAQASGRPFLMVGAHTALFFYGHLGAPRQS